MYVLGINGSPRKGGNSDILLERALSGARKAGAETENIFLHGLDISPCQEEEYERVDTNGLSVIKDDIHIIFDKMGKADAVLLASPIFFGSLSAQMKIMIDRFQCVWISNALQKKDLFSRRTKGGLILVEATHNNKFLENAKFIVKQFFALLHITYARELFCMGFDEKGSINASPDLLDQADALGRNLVQ